MVTKLWELQLVYSDTKFDIEISDSMKILLYLNRKL